VPALINGRRFQASSAVGQSLSPIYAAELSENGEIFDSDDDDDDGLNDLLFVKQILAFPKRAIKVIDLTYDDNSDNKSDDGNHIKVNWLRYTRIAQHRVTLTFISFNRPFPGRRPIFFLFHRSLY
jgi:hypothetical protein